MYGNSIKAAGALALGLTALSCDAGTFLEPAFPLEVLPATATVPVGGTLQLQVHDDSHNQITTDFVVWTSSDTTVAVVDAKGLVTGRTHGDIDMLVAVNGVSGTAAITVTDSVSGYLTIVPGDTHYGIGETTALAVSAVGADGSPIADPEVRWTSSDPDIAKVDSMGTVTGRAVGIAVIAASAVGLSGDSLEVVVDSLPQKPWIHQDFDEYADIAALDADTETWAASEAKSGGVVAIDSTTAFSGQSKSLRYDYTHSDPCSTITNTRQLALPENQQELWIEIPMRWSSNFDTRPSPEICATNAGDHKTFFGITEDANTARWDFKVGTQGSVVMKAAGTNGGENDERYISTSVIDPQDLWNGEWHVIRLQFRHSSDNVSGDGLMRVWVDGALIYEETGITTQTDDGLADRIRALSLGRNQDKGPQDVTMSLWWGYVRAYRSNPGWY